MKNVTVNVQIQFDVTKGDKEEVAKILDSMTKILQERMSFESPIIFTNSLDSSDIEVHTPEDEEIDASEGIETNFGYMEVVTAMLEDDNGTDLHEGVDVRIEGEFVGEVVGGTKYFESVEALEEWYSINFDDQHPDWNGNINHLQ
jgi:hypothetical protein